MQIGAATRLGAGLQPHDLQQRHVVDAHCGLVAVVRGYGGQSSGDTAVDGVCAELARALHADPVAAVTSALAAASARIAREPADGAPRHAAVTALIVAPAVATVIHIGGGRAYLLRDGTLRRLTADHTRTLDTDAGPIVVLERALGTSADVPDVVRIDRLAGDRYVVVDEIAGGALAEEELAAVMQRQPAQQIADEIVERAHRRAVARSATAIAVTA